MEHNKALYITLADTYNKLLKENKDNDLSAAYAVVMGQTWPYYYNSMQDRNYQVFATEFLDAANAMGYKFHKPITLVGNGTITLGIFPHEAPRSSRKGAYGLKPLLNTKDARRPALTGIGVKDSCVYATDGHVLIKVFDNRWQAYEGTIIPPDQLKVIESGITPILIDSKQPHYDSVLTVKAKAKISWEWDAEAFTNLLYGAYIGLKNSDATAQVVSLKFKATDPVCYYDSARFYHLVHILRGNGARKITLLYHDSTSGLLVCADNGNMGAIMSQQICAQVVTARTQTIANANI